MLPEFLDVTMQLDGNFAPSLDFKRQKVSTVSDYDLYENLHFRDTSKVRELHLSAYHDLELSALSSEYKLIKVNICLFNNFR